MDAHRILAVDDDRLALNLIERLFEEDPDIDAVVTQSPADALDRSAREGFDLVIADQRMSEMTGIDFLRRFRELQPTAVRILLTAYPDLATSLEAINEGLVYRFMLKPWNVDEMRVSVRRALEARRVAEENEQLTEALREQFDDLVQSERMATIGRLSAGIGHELANALTPLLGHLALLRTRVEPLLDAASPSDVSGIQRSLDAMQAAGRQASAIVGGLQGYSHRNVDAAPWSANRGVETALQLVQHRARGKVAIERDLGEVPEVVCHGEELVQVLVNLIGNALDEVVDAGRGRVRIHTDATADEVRIAVSDTGRGLPSVVREQLFAPFVSTKPAGRGTGLGLSICKRLVEDNGGAISVATAEGRGTTFTVALPRTPRASDRIQIAPTPH